MNNVRWQNKQSRFVAAFAAALVALSFALATPAFGQQCTDSWTGADGNGEWSDGKNWSTGNVPGSSDTACVLINGAAVNQYNNQDSVANLELGSTDSLTLSNVPNTNNGFFVDGTFIVNNGQIIIPYTASNQTGTCLCITSGGNTTLSGTGAVVISNGSEISGAGPGGNLINQSTITGGGAIQNGLTLNNSSTGVINANVSGVQFVVGRMTTTTNTGLLEATGGGQMVIGSTDLTNVGGTLSASGTGSSVTFAGQGEGGQTITGGTFTTSSGGGIYTETSTTLDGTNGNTIANQGSLVLPDVGNNPGSGFQGTFNNSGTIQILSHGDNVTLGVPSGQTFTLQGNGNLTMGDGTSNAYNNQNYISGTGIFVNQQLVQGTGGIENLSGFTNSGTVNANIPTGTNNLQLVIYRDGTTSNTGTLEATKGGALVLEGLAIDNQHGTVKAVGKNSTVTLNGMTLSGGKISSSGGGLIYGLQGALIDGATDGTTTNTGTILIPAYGNNQGLLFQGAVTNNGTIQILANANSGIAMTVPGGETFTLSGSGSVIMGDGTGNAYNNQNYITGNGAFVNQQVVQGSGAIQSINGFTNKGTVNANIPPGANGLQLMVDRIGTTANNTGTMEATNGGSLTLGGPFNNAGGTIEAVGTNSTVTLNGATISGGTLSTSSGGVINDLEQSLLDGTTNPVVIDGTLAVPAGYLADMQGTVKNTGTIAVQANSSNGGGQVYISSGETWTLTGNGNLVMGDGTNNSYNNDPNLSSYGGNLVNQSTIEGTGNIRGIVTETNQGTISANVPVGSAGLLLVVCCEGSGGISNSGTMEAANGGELQIAPANFFTNTGTLTAQVNSTIDITTRFTNLSNNTLTGGTYTVAGTLMVPGNIDTNAAKITLNGTASQILNPNTNALAGFVTNTSKAAFTLSGQQSFTSAGTFTNQGSITINTGSTFTVGASGSYEQTGGKTTVDGTLTLSGSRELVEDADPETAGTVQITKGSLYGNGGNVAAHVISSGTVVPADSTTTVGTLKISGGYTQKPKGALDANISGASAGQFNVLNVTGTVTLGGTLNIGLLNGFVPAVGDSFEILTARQVSGTFATVNGSKINDSEHFTVTYNPGNVTLTVVSGS